MKRIAILAVLLWSAVAYAQLGTVNGNCQVGDVFPQVQGLTATAPFMGSYPLCTVTVYLTGTTNKATIYSTSTGSALGNPFTANADGSFVFWAAVGAGLDVQTSAGSPYVMPSTVTLTDVFPNGIGGNPGLLSGVYYPATCGGSTPPSWCAGTDIGGWINAAAAQLTGKCGEIYVPAGNFSFNTTIFISRCTHLHGASGYSTNLTWTGASGWSVIVADAFGSDTGTTSYPVGALEDMSLIGPGNNVATGAIYLGGSDGASAGTYSPVASPSTGSDPGSYFGDHFNINRVHVGTESHGFGVGIQFGQNAWSDTVLESDIVFNNVGYLVPAVATFTGERLSIIASSVHNSVAGLATTCGGVTCAGDGIFLGSNAAGQVDLTITNSAIDYNAGWSIHNGGSTASQNTVTMVGGHVESFAQWAYCKGSCNFNGVLFNSGTSGGTLGYLIDCEMGSNGYCLFTGDWFHNNGAGVLFNTGGTRPIIISSIAAGSGGLNYYGTLLPISTGLITLGNGTFGATSNQLIFNGNANSTTINAGNPGSNAVWSIPTGPTTATFASINNAQTFSGAQTFSQGLVAGGTQATLTGTGACATHDTQTGGSWSGNVRCTGTTGAATLVITPGATAPAGWSCWGSDNNTGHELVGAQSGGSNTSCTLKFTSVTNNDFINFSANPF